jgi:hypothetical protein
MERLAQRPDLASNLEPTDRDYHRAHARRRDVSRPRLNALGSLLQGRLPPLTGFEPPVGIEIEKQIVPAVANKPVAQGDGLGIVPARMAKEEARHFRNRRLGHTTMHP